MKIIQFLSQNVFFSIGVSLNLCESRDTAPKQSGHVVSHMCMEFQSLTWPAIISTLVQIWRHLKFKDDHHLKETF